MLVAATASAPFACSSLSPEERPALLADSTPASRAELARVVTAAADGRPALLADDALTRDSELTLEQREPAGQGGRLATGRTLDAPLKLKLVLRGDRCVLVRESDQREWPLDAARCVPAPR
jgi:hypothetical protein